MIIIEPRLSKEENAAKVQSNHDYEKEKTW
jgi:hypothetical protein